MNNLKDSIQFVEPAWGKQLMIALNDWMVKHDLLIVLVPYIADIFVFTYPVYLVGLYLYGVNKHKNYYKEAALAIFFSAAGAAIVNQVIQFFGDKSRPEEAILNQQNLILSHLPTDPFPSDHAAVSVAVAMATTLRGLKHKDKKFLRGSLFFRTASLTMCFSRVAVAIHWPTDIIAGILVGVTVTLLIFSRRIWNRLLAKVIMPLISIEKRLFRTICGVQQ